MMAVNFVIKELPSAGFIGVLFVFTGGLTESLRLRISLKALAGRAKVGTRL
jgi:hypothetical protein